MPPQGSQVILRLKSRQFDTYLQVLDGRSGELLFSNDDTERGTDSRLVFTAQRGIEYVVRATSYGIEETGRYSLTMRQVRPTIRNFSFTYGYGLVDAAAAIARVRGSAIRRFASASSGHQRHQRGLESERRRQPPGLESGLSRTAAGGRRHRYGRRSRPP